MADKEYEADDPLEMRGVQIPSQSEAQLRDMALCFAEEFIREGWSQDDLFKMFQNPFYQGPHLAWKQKGDAFVVGVIEEAAKIWQPLLKRRTGG